MKDPRDIILAPVVSEKSYALMETGVYTFKVRASASKPEIRDAVEAIWGVEVLQGQHAQPQGQGNPGAQQQPDRLEARHEARHRHAGSGRDPAVRELRSAMAIRSRKPTSAGRRFQTSSDFSEVTKSTPEKSLLAKKSEVRRPQRPRPQDLAPHRRRSQAALPRDRLQAHQGRRDRQGRRHRVRPQPHLPDRPACTTPTARRPTSWPPRA